LKVETGAQVAPAFEDFENLAAVLDQWTVNDGIWEFGAPTSGPGAAHSGNNCLATVLGGNYPDNMISRAVGPPFVVPAAAQNPQLRFWQWYSAVTNDFVKVQISTDNGATWNDLSGNITGDSGGWG